MARSVEDRVKDLKRDMVLRVYLGSGLFGENVRRARIVQGVRPEPKLPPPHVSPPSSVNDQVKLQSWRTSVRIAWESVVPRAYREALDWDSFTAACILYDSPELQLEEFAGYGGSAPAGSKRPAAKPKSGKGRHATTPAISWIDSEGHRAAAVERFYQDLISELGRRFFEPRGLDVWQAVSEIHTQTDLLAKLRASMENIETHPFIAVDRYTNDEDVDAAARAIRSMQEVKNPGGRPSRDPLLAIKCAALHYDHNYRDSDDRRRWRWSYHRLAEDLGLVPPDDTSNEDPELRHKRLTYIGKKYVKLGEELRKERQRNMRA
jgi:hypothetical protein